MRKQHKRVSLFRKTMMPFLLLLLAGSIYYLGVPKHTPASEPKEPLGRVVIIELPNGNTMTTYEAYIVKKGEKLFYKGKDSEIDITGGKITFK